MRDFSIENIKNIFLKRPYKKVPVVCVETGDMFGSCTEAGDAYDIDSTSISCCVRGKYKTAGGYHWRRATEEEWVSRRTKMAEEIIAKILSNAELMEKTNNFKNK